eukprot:jgi/Mesen1/9168/ME000591S08487
MQVCVKNLQGRSALLEPSGARVTAGCVKQQAVSALQEPLGGRYKLFYQGRGLKDSTLLETLQLQEGQFLVLVTLAPKHDPLPVGRIAPSTCSVTLTEQILGRGSDARSFAGSPGTSLPLPELPPGSHRQAGGSPGPDKGIREGEGREREGASSHAEGVSLAVGEGTSAAAGSLIAARGGACLHENDGEGGGAAWTKGRGRGRGRGVGGQGESEGLEGRGGGGRGGSAAGGGGAAAGGAGEGSVGAGSGTAAAAPAAGGDGGGDGGGAGGDASVAGRVQVGEGRSEEGGRGRDASPPGPEEGAAAAAGGGGRGGEGDLLASTSGRDETGRSTPAAAAGRRKRKPRGGLACADQELGAVGRSPARKVALQGAPSPQGAAAKARKSRRVLNSELAQAGAAERGQEHANGAMNEEQGGQRSVRTGNTPLVAPGGSAQLADVNISTGEAMTAGRGPVSGDGGEVPGGTEVLQGKGARTTGGRRGGRGGGIGRGRSRGARAKQKEVGLEGEEGLSVGERASGERPDGAVSSVQARGGRLGRVRGRGRGRGRSQDVPGGSSSVAHLNPGLDEALQEESSADDLPEGVPEGAPSGAIGEEVMEERGKKRQKKEQSKKEDPLLASLPLPPVLASLQQKFEALNALCGFLLRQHLQATWRNVGAAMRQLSMLGGRDMSSQVSPGFSCRPIVALNSLFSESFSLSL